MKTPTRALVVEDVDDWSTVLERAARRAGASEVVVCRDLGSLRDALRWARFDIALLDIGLDQHDDTQSDGAKALALIREIDGDGTPCVIVTGWPGDRLDLQATLSRDFGVEWAYMKERYDAATVIGKLSELLQNAGERRIAATSMRTTPMRALAADVEPFVFEDQVIRRLSPTSGIETVYTLVARLLAPVLPLVPLSPREPMSTGSDGALVGVYWSRALAAAVAVELVTVDDLLDDDVAAAHLETRLSLPQRPERLGTANQRNLVGRLWELPTLSRDRFPR